METNLHLQEKVLQNPKLFFMCSTFFAVMQKNLGHLHKKDVSLPIIRSKEREKGSALWPQLAFQMQTTCFWCKWYSEKLAQRRINVEAGMNIWLANSPHQLETPARAPGNFRGNSSCAKWWKSSSLSLKWILKCLFQVLTFMLNLTVRLNDLESTQLNLELE